MGSNKCKAFLFFLVGSVIPLRAFGIEQLERLWKARGLQAQEKISQIIKKYPSIQWGKPGNLKQDLARVSVDDKCKFLLESSFAVFAMKSDVILHLPTETTFLLKLMDGEKDTANVAVEYTNGEHNPKGIELSKLDSSWSVAVLRKSSSIAVMGDGCLFVFDFKKPLDPYGAALNN